MPNTLVHICLVCLLQINVINGKKNVEGFRKNVEGFRKNVEGFRKYMEGFVVGGERAKIKDHPHAAYLSVNCEHRSMCGSSVLNQLVLITAAHCLARCSIINMEHQIKAVFGQENVKQAGLERLATDIMVHEHFDERTLQKDIALLLLAKPVPFSEKIKRIIVARNFPVSEGEGILAGWGDTEGNERKILNQVYQKLKSDKTCRTVGNILSGTFCAGSHDSKSYPSSGDSGSGLVTLKSYELMGLVSYRNPQYKHLVVYTNVTYYFKWIENNAKTLYCRRI